MASFGKLTGQIRARSQKFKTFIRANIPLGIKDTIVGASVVIRAANKFLSSFGKQAQQLINESRARLDAQDPTAQMKMRDRAIAELTARTKEDIKDVVDRFSRGRLTVTTLQSEIQSILRAGTLAAAAIGSVGVGNLTENVLTASQRQLSKQFESLDGFINELSTRELTQRDQTRFLAYAASLHSIAQTASSQMSLDTYGDPTALEEIRELGSADHCDQCIALAALGWVPFGTLPPIGSDTYCGENCQCTKRVRMKTDNNEQSQPVVQT